VNLGWNSRCRGCTPGHRRTRARIEGTVDMGVVVGPNCAKASRDDVKLQEPGDAVTQLEQIEAPGTWAGQRVGGSSRQARQGLSREIGRP
jgi:hypothetical protein